MSKPAQISASLGMGFPSGDYSGHFYSAKQTYTLYLTRTHANTHTLARTHRHTDRLIHTHTHMQTHKHKHIHGIIAVCSISRVP